MIAMATRLHGRRLGIVATLDIMQLDGRGVSADTAADQWDELGGDEQGYLLAAHSELFPGRHSEHGEMRFGA